MKPNRETGIRRNLTRSWNASYRADERALLEDEDRQSPKEYFKMLVSLLRKKHNGRPFSIVDVGCASGSFLDYAMKHLPIRDVVGLDISQKLLRHAARKIPTGRFYRDSILKLSSLKGQTFDVCTCLGVVAIFDELQVVLKKLLSLIRPGGTLWVFDSVNEDPVDTLIRFRRVSASQVGPWRKGLNQRSLLTWQRVLRGIDNRLHLKSWDFHISVDLPKTQDPLRSWTQRCGEGSRQLMVGTGQLLSFKILCVQKV